MIQSLQQVFGSITKSLDVLYVIKDAKPCARMLVLEDDAGKAADFLNKNGLRHSISDFKVMKQNIQSEFYSDMSVKIPKNSGEKGHFIFCLILFSLAAIFEV